MYFRDMAELDVLRPEQEFETARKIEEMELNLWRTILGFAPGADWILDVVEREVGKPLLEVKVLPAAAAEGAPQGSSIPARGRFDKTATALGTKLRALDIDRIFLDAALAEIQRVGRARPRASLRGDRSVLDVDQGFRRLREDGVGQKAFRLKAAKNEFVKANLRLVVSIARRFNHGRLPLADLIQEGNIGLMKAVERYDYRRGFRFSTYASWWIRHAISRALADKGRAVRLPVHMIDAYHRIAKSPARAAVEARAAADHPGDRGGDGHRGREAREDEDLPRRRRRSRSTARSPTRTAGASSTCSSTRTRGRRCPTRWRRRRPRARCSSFSRSLKPIEADILRKRFGLLNDRERTLKEIGDEYRLSRERVRQLQEQALGKMRRAMAKRESV